MPAKSTTRKKRTRKSAKKPPLAERVATTAEVEAELAAEQAAVSAIVESEVNPENPKSDLGSSSKPDNEEAPQNNSGQPLPSWLQERIDNAMRQMSDVEAEIEKFKSDPLYMPGDLPVTLHGLHSDAYGNSTPSLNFIDKRWLDPNVYYRWGHKKMIEWHRARGVTPVRYDAFQSFITKRGGPELTFEKTAQNHIQCGDLILMATSMDHYNNWICARTRRKRDGRKRKSVNQLRNLGENLGRDYNGIPVEVFEGDEVKNSPTAKIMQSIRNMIREELGEMAPRLLLK